MKISSLNTYVEEGQQFVSVTVATNSPDIAQAISSVLALFETGSTQHHVIAQPDEAVALFKAANAALEAVDATVAKAQEQQGTPPATTGRTRRPRTNPDAAPAAEVPHTDAPAEPEAPAGRRARRVTAEAPPAPPSITDNDLVKAASNAAAIISPEVVKLVLKDLGHEEVGKLPADLRQKFLDELAEEVELAKAEAAAKG